VEREQRVELCVKNKCAHYDILPTRHAYRYHFKEKQYLLENNKN